MKRVKKLVATIIIAGMACQIMPINIIAAEVNTIRVPEAYGATPNKSQLRYHEEELAAFIHFGMNTFTNSEWGSGKENPNSFNPTDLDTDEWVKTLKDAGFKRVIIVGKHHDGFALWKSSVTEHDIENSKDWQATRDGEGDVLEELSKSCTKYDMDMGIYLSPWDANASSYGYGTGTNEETDSNGDYNEFYMEQLREILGNDKYGNNGKFVEVWMDGAKGSGAAAQNYKFEEWFDLIEELEPGAVVFSPYATDVRWIGNESGKAGDPVWSKINKKRIRDRYNAGLGEENKYLNNGDPNGDIWSVGECDVSLTSGWFWHAGNGPKTMEQLTEIYFNSVGRGQPLLLNVAPDRTGHFTSADIARIKEFSSAINKSFDENLVDETTTSAVASAVRGNSNDYSANNVLDDNDDTYWSMDDGQTTGNITIDLGEEKTFDIVSIEEYIKLGQRISEFSVEVYSNGAWKEFSSGYTIGAKRLVRGIPVKASKIKINIKSSLAVPLIENIEVYKADEAFEMKSLVPSGTDFIDNINFENKNSWNQENIGIGNTGMYSSTKGTNASFTFTGTKAWVVGTFDPNHGIMEVWVDDEKVTDVDTYNSKRSISQILYETEDLEYGEHTVKVVVKGEKNSSAKGTAIGLDCAYYLNNNGAGMFEIENTNYTVDEGEEKEITIKRVGGSNGAATVHFSTSPDSAVHGRHYNDINETIEFADGQTTAKVSVGTIDNNEKAGDVKFYCNIDTPTNGSIIGFNKKSEITIIDNDVNKPYTEADPFMLPNTLEDKRILEAELFTLNPISGNKYVRISENSQASNGKVVTWFESGNKIRVPFYAEKAGTYIFNMSYQSGRSEGNLNKINWSGTNIESNSKSVPGTGNQNPVPIIKTSFEVVVTKAGAGELIFTADSQSSPNIDVFEVSAKELKEVTHTITATAGENGSISPAGEVTLEDGQSKIFTFIPNEGYEVGDVIVDGSSVGVKDSYTIENIKKDMTINVIFKLLVDKSELNTVIGEANEIKNNGEKYTEVSLNILNSALEKANEVLANEDATKEMINDAVSSLRIAIDSLVKEEVVTSEANKKLLTIVIEYAEDVKEKGALEDVVPLVVKEFEEALKEAKIVLVDEDATQEQVDVVSDRLIKVIHMLEFKKGDKKDLKKLVEVINALDESKYTKSTWAVLQAELENANKVIIDENAMKEEVYKSFESLNSAFTKLELTADKSKLEKLVVELESKDLSKYTIGSVNKFNEELKSTKVILSSNEATQEQVDEAYNKLIRAYLELRLIPDKSKLEELINKSEAIDISKYTEESINKLNEKLSEVKSVLDNKEATQEEVNNAVDELEIALAGLEEKKDNTSTDEVNNDETNNDDTNISKDEEKNEESNSSNDDIISSNEEKNEEKNEELPKTGGSSMGSLLGISISLTSLGAILRRKNRER